MAAAQGDLEETLSCDGPGFSGVWPLLPECTSLSGSQTADHAGALPRMGYGGLRTLPTEVLSSPDPAAFCLEKTKFVGQIGTL